ncbi:hypothetical protein BJY54_006955 [Streptomyces nodosus]|nr:hypothetical protein [Streptomyces nodosus]
MPALTPVAPTVPAGVTTLAVLADPQAREAQIFHGERGQLYRQTAPDSAWLVLEPRIAAAVKHPLTARPSHRLRVPGHDTGSDDGRDADVRATVVVSFRVHGPRRRLRELPACLRGLRATATEPSGRMRSRATVRRSRLSPTVSPRPRERRPRQVPGGGRGRGRCARRRGGDLYPGYRHAGRPRFQQAGSHCSERLARRVISATETSGACTRRPPAGRSGTASRAGPPAGGSGSCVGLRPAAATGVLCGSTRERVPPHRRHGRALRGMRRRGNGFAYRMGTRFPVRSVPWPLLRMHHPPRCGRTESSSTPSFAILTPAPVHRRAMPARQRDISRAEQVKPPWSGPLKDWR